MWDELNKSTIDELCYMNEKERLKNDIQKKFLGNTCNRLSHFLWPVFQDPPFYTIDNISYYQISIWLIYTSYHDTWLTFHNFNFAILNIVRFYFDIVLIVEMLNLVSLMQYSFWRGLYIMLYIAHTHSSSRTKQRIQHGSNFRFFSLLLHCCIIARKKNRNGYYRYCYHHNHFSKTAAVEIVFRIFYGWKNLRSLSWISESIYTLMGLYMLKAFYGCKKTK